MRKELVRKDRWSAPLYDRVEVLWTIILDVGLIVGAVIARHYALAAINKFAAEDGINWAIRGVELIADVGLVLAVAVITIFDLMKRARQAYLQMKSR